MVDKKLSFVFIPFLFLPELLLQSVRVTRVSLIGGIYRPGTWERAGVHSSSPGLAPFQGHVHGSVEETRVRILVLWLSFKSAILLIVP